MDSTLIVIVLIDLSKKRVKQEQGINNGFYVFYKVRGDIKSHNHWLQPKCCSFQRYV